MMLAESWLRMIVVRKATIEDTPQQKFDAKLREKDTGQKRSDKSN